MGITNTGVETGRMVLIPMPAIITEILAFGRGNGYVFGDGDVDMDEMYMWSRTWSAFMTSINGNHRSSHNHTSNQTGIVTTRHRS